MPYLIGSVADGMGLGVDQAGLLGSAELLIVALSAFAMLLVVMALSAVVGWHINQKLRLASS